MLDCANLAVPKEVMQHVVHVESARNPFAIGVVGGYLAKQPRSLPEALAAVRQLKEEGYNFSVGIAQVNRYNLAKYGLNTYAQAFEACPSLQAGSRILRECYDRAQDWGKAFSCYYSGNFVTGFEHGYVQKIFASMRRNVTTEEAETASVRIIPYNSASRKRVREDGVPLVAGPAAVSTVVAPVAAVSSKNQAVVPPSVDAYPESYAVRRYLPRTPPEVTAAALQWPSMPLTVIAAVETAEDRPAIPVPGPGAIAPQPPSRTASSRGGIGEIPTQVVGINGDPYQTRIVAPPTKGLSADQLPLPDPNASSAAADGGAPGYKSDPQTNSMTARKGGGLLVTTESSGPPENTADGPQASGEKSTPPGKSAGADKSFVF